MMHHITHIDNLENILKFGLCSRNFLIKNGYSFKDTANLEIISKRGELNNSIPFHINCMQKSHQIPYNYILCEEKGYDNMIFLCVNPKKVKYKLKYILYHPTSIYAKEYDDLETFKRRYIEELNRLKKEFDFSYHNNEVKEFRMSEILISENSVKLDENWKIKIYSEKNRQKIEDLLKKCNKKINVEVDIKFYKNKRENL